jgi:hypothetical protein
MKKSGQISQLLWLLSLSLSLHGVNGYFARVCTLNSYQIQSVGINDDTGEASIVEASIVPPDDPNRNLFENLDMTPAIFTSGSSNTIPKSSLLRGLQEQELQQGGEMDPNKNSIGQSGNFTRILRVRECTCSAMTIRGYYCPVAQDTCGLQREGHIACFKQSSRIILLRNAWPIVMLWYAALVLFILCTTQGRHARNYVSIRCCNPQLNETIATQILHPLRSSRGNRLRRWRYPFWELEDPVAVLSLDDDDPSDEEVEEQQQQRGRPNQLALKTKRFVAPKETNQEEEPLTCTICFANLEDGERIGALLCEHVFHASCLKIWLARRNVCPLCQRADVAVPHHHDDGMVREGLRQPSQVSQQTRQPLEVAQETDNNARRGGPFRGRVILRRNR